MGFEEKMTAERVVEVFFEPKKKLLLSGDLEENRLENQAKNQFLGLMETLSRDLKSFAIKTKDVKKTGEECSKRFQKLKSDFLRTFNLNDDIMALPYKKAIETIQKL